MNDMSISKKQEVAHGGSVQVESNRAIQEAQAAMVIAKRFPRDTDESFTKILKACSRKTFAESALYAYPRGNEIISGPSIRLAETIAQCWKNIQFGFKQISSSGFESEVEAYAWDVENNIKQTRTFYAKHTRDTKWGQKKLTSERDIYEMIANLGARRLRACILGIIPADIVEASVAKCNESMRSGSGGDPIVDRVRSMLLKFDALGVNKIMIENRLGYKTEAINETALVSLGKIYNSIKDDMTTREAWFDFGGNDKPKESSDLNKKLKEQK